MKTNFENQSKPVKIEVTNEVKKDLQKQHVGYLKPKPNHHIFEVDTINLTIKHAKFDPENTAKWGYRIGIINKNISVKKDCIYITALNKKNVLKILERNFSIKI